MNKGAASRIKMYKIPQKIKVETHRLIEKLSNERDIQVILMKLWSLSGKVEELIECYFA